VSNSKELRNSKTLISKMAIPEDLTTEDSDHTYIHVVLHSPQAGAIPPQDRQRIHDPGDGFGEDGITRASCQEHELDSIPDPEALFVVIGGSVEPQKLYKFHSVKIFRVDDRTPCFEGIPLELHHGHAPTHSVPLLEDGNLERLPRILPQEIGD
jgi:hypothetical protein